MKVKAISMSIYSNPLYKGCSNGGISTKYDEILVECETGPREVDINNPPENFCKVIVRQLYGVEVRHFEPYKPVDKGSVGYMAGGAYVATSDSRGRDIIGGYYAISLHDRQETQEVYERLSN